jgi:Xaa-Pro dipeptidase
MAAFERNEYLGRLAETRRRMQAAGVDAMLVINWSNLHYLIGYEGWSDYVPQVLVVDENEEPRLIVREMDVPCAVHSAFISPKNVFGYSEDFIANQFTHPYDHFAQLFQRWGIDGKRLGIELSGASLTPKAYARLQAVLPNATFVDCSGLVTWQRLKKSSAELVYMRQAGKIADLAMQAAIDGARAGVRECDVGALAMAAQCRGTPEFGGDRPKSPHFGVGVKSSSPHLGWTDDVLKPGTAVNIELGGHRMRYVAGLSRTIHIGEPPKKLQDLHQATREAMEVTFGSLRPGWTCEEVEALVRTTTRRHGYEKKSRVGYAIGIDWTELSASFRPGDMTVLEPDMTFHLMLGMWYDDWGYVLSEAFQVTDRGAKSFSALPRDLFVK